MTPKFRRITFLVNELNMGGAERYALDLCREWRSRGVDARLASLEPGGVVQDIAQDQGVPCIQGPGHLHLSPVRKWITLQRMQRFLDRLDTDVLISCTAKPNVLAGLVPRRPSCWIWTQLDEGLYRPRSDWEALALSRADAFMANSHASARHLTEDLQVAPSRILITRNGIALPNGTGCTDSPVRRELGMDSKTPVALMLANMRPPKDHPTVLKAWRSLLDQWKLPRKPVLWLVGREDLDYRPLIRQMDLQDHVFQLGYRSDLDQILREADVAVFASSSEGLPYAVLECMAAGLPVVANALPALKECLGPDPVPALVPTGDSPAFAQSLRDLFENPGQAADAGTINRQRIARCFDLKVAADQILNYLNREGMRHAHSAT